MSNTDDVNADFDPSQWLDDHGDVLYRYAVARLRDSDDAEEMVQETLLAALKSRDNFAGQSSERTWLVGILKHKIVDHLRRRQRQTSTEDWEAAATVEDFFDKRNLWRNKPSFWKGSPDEVLEQEEFWDVFRKCVSGLPARLSEVFSLREMEEMASDRICDILGVTATNLRTLLHRARLQLRACLESHWFGTQKE